MTEETIVGGCQCGALRFKLTGMPLFTHACHCFTCRRRSGSAFGLSTFVLRDDLTLTEGEVGARQSSSRTTVYLCEACGTTIYSQSTEFPLTYIVRGGILDNPSFVEPGAHLWVKRKHPWIVLSDNVPQFEEDYDYQAIWPRESLRRVDAACTAGSQGIEVSLER